ncbi:hypothetical protein KC343_g15147 [Hortaea werneckii]|uniref:Oxidase ustYa n=1 Tax=Hortaea werneckii TaxID=91943 RepID=A0A3M7ET26_HORWE|nr:hypothetical protein KC352_g19560 [Hortaea werneckii]KAI7570787.1 hypothetical protein KC317_g2180 [Hortaea werneckii]KAI7601726.1 hypothetical protein KC343_g15147 [Hortaea werneckii]KAI7617015.1 hypothetical protein KC346_g5697 [Hortaea werneckii]KAI7678973.1 hypothetical protein KC319_g3014 [Hortaea werneckii]
MPDTFYRPLAVSEGDEKEDAFYSDRGVTRQRAFYPPLLTLLPWLLSLLFGLSTLTLLVTHKPPLQIAGDVARISPSFNQEIITFQPNQSFIANLSSPNFQSSARQSWLDLIPQGFGFLHVANPEQHPELPPPYHRHNKTVYTTSMTHQLHCLYMIAGSWNDLAVNGYMPPIEGEEDPHWHIAHCFDYLRQAIMCAGDVALEGQETTLPPGHTGTDGWNVQHVCKAYGEVYEWLERMRVDNRTRI